MPYSSNKELPKQIKDSLPKGAQDIFRGAFNSAVSSGKSEENAFKIAWGAVKRKYRKIGNKWTKKNFDEMGKMVTTPTLPANQPTLTAENLAGGKKKPKRRRKK